MTTIGDEDFCDDWMRGYNDCKIGVPHDECKSESYKRGYGTRYEEEQLMTAGVLKR